MKYRKSEVLRMVKGLLAAPEDALDCGQALARLPAAVDAVIAGKDVAEDFPRLMAHLEMCDQCCREFEDLLEITRRAKTGALLEPERLPRFDLQQVRERVRKTSPKAKRGQFLARFRRYLETLRTETLGAGVAVLRDATLSLLIAPARPALQPVPVRAPSPPPTRQSIYPIEPLGLQITLNVREFERHRFTIRGLIESDTTFEGVGVTLFSSEDDEPLDSTQVDDTNTFSFHGVGPGRYSIRLDLTGEEAILLTDVDI